MSTEYAEPLNVVSKPLNRLTYLLNIYHQQAGEQPKTIHCAYSELLELEQEAYTRRMRATEAWVALDLGWMNDEEVGFIVVENLEGRAFQVNPTEQEKAEVAGRVLEIAFATSLDDAWPIPPRLCFPAPVERAGDLRLRCRCGEAQYRLHVIPR